MKTSDRFLLLVAEGFGTGRAAVAPGTFGSLPGTALIWALGEWNTAWWQFLAVWAAMFAVGIPLCTRAAHLRGKKDPGSVVWDEITAFPLIAAIVQVSPKSLIVGYIAFRVFDIAKPWPVRRFESLPDGLGVMADDQVAAIYAAAATMLVLQAL